MLPAMQTAPTTNNATATATKITTPTTSSNATKTHIIKTAIERNMMRLVHQQQQLNGEGESEDDCELTSSSLHEEVAEDLLNADDDEDDEAVADAEYAVINYYSDTSVSSSAAAIEEPVTIAHVAVKPRYQSPMQPQPQTSGWPSKCPTRIRLSRPMHVDARSASHSYSVSGLKRPASMDDDDENDQDQQQQGSGCSSNSSATLTPSNTSLLSCNSIVEAAIAAEPRFSGGGLGFSSPSIEDDDDDDDVDEEDTASASCTPSPTPSSTLGVNMRVTGQCSQGGRKYMEDQFSVAYQESPVTRELEYAFFGIYDGHGGTEAALFAKERLMLAIVEQKLFWSDNDEDVLRAIREGYIATHFAMWHEQEKWPRTANGHLSTAGTTATVAFMRREKIYIGHVGDSGIVLGYQNENEKMWRAKQLTTDHKPESVTEKMRIQRSGGNVTIKSGVPRVVWNRPRDPFHRGPIKQRTPVDDIPFLAVARSLGDLWSYNSRCNEFVVSPDPDVKVVKINPKTFRCLIFGTDGLWNVVTPQEAVDSVREKHIIGECLREQDAMNPSKALVDRALKTWAAKKMRADNTSVVTVILTPVATAPAATPPSDMSLQETAVSAALRIEEYAHDTPYSALAKRHKPPEAYLNFDYYEKEEESEYGTSQLAYMETERLSNHSKFWRKVRHESRSMGNVASAWNLAARNGGAGELARDEDETVCRVADGLDLHTVVEDVDDDDDDDMEEEEDDDDEEPEIEEEEAAAAAEQLERQQDAHGELLAIYGNAGGVRQTGGYMTATDAPTAHMAVADSNSGELAELEHHLEHSFSSYATAAAAATATAGTDYSFAESYNSLLNEQQAARTRSAAAATPQPPTHLLSNQRSMQEILQEQQRYQQQEGYSLTRLETRREQQQAAAADHVAEPWTQPPPPQQTQYVAQQPAELLELDALLQQERDEERQVALEQQRLRQELAAAAASSSSTSLSSRVALWMPETGTSSSDMQLAVVEEPTLQDNEVSSTLPTTPVPTPAEQSRLATAVLHFQETVAEIRKEDAHAVHYIFEQIHKLQQAECTPALEAAGVGVAMERANAAAGELQLQPARRHQQMRRYRNVPNENHQHQQAAPQTRWRQKFKHTKSKSFIAASAAAIVAYSSPSTSGSSSGGATSSRTGTSEASSLRSVATSSASSRRSGGGNRSSSAAAAAGGVMMTRRSHSSVSQGGVSKRQLRSSICALDINKRTLRTRNAPTTAGGSNRNGGTFPKPVAPATARSLRTRRPIVAEQQQLLGAEQQRRSLRRSTLSSNNAVASGSNTNSTGGPAGGGGYSKPTRLQCSSGVISARPPPSPKKLQAAAPTLNIAAAVSELNKRWFLRSSSQQPAASASAAAHGNGALRLSGSSSLMPAISCYGASRTRVTTRRR